MKLSEVMKKVNIDNNFDGEVKGDDYILALDCTAEGDADHPDKYDVASVHVSNYGAELSPETDSTNFYYEGYTSMKKSTSRKFKPVGKRLVGDAFQDFVCSHAIKYGVGSAVVRNYVFFCALTGKGEKGEVLILVNNDGTAESGAIGDIDVELQVIGTPEEYTYAASTQNTGG